MDDAVATTGPAPSERLLTIGIPVFNGKSLLRNCLQSVVTSTLPHSRFEILVADDGSSEPETLDILDEFERQLAAEPGLFRVLRLGTNSGGAALPRNRILDEASGEYVLFLDSDDAIGPLALERIAEALATTPADWVALNQVPVNGRGAFCEIRRPFAEVPRAQALTTLTVHKVFRRAEIERQQLRFDEELPSGQDLAFAFSYILKAERFLMLGGYDYYYLTQHTGNPNEPPHLSRRDNTPQAQVEKNERILRSMLESLRQSSVSDTDRRTIVCRVILPRVLVIQGHLKAVVNAGPAAGTHALRRLDDLLADPLVTDIDPAELKWLTAEHLAVIHDIDWGRLARLLDAVQPESRTRRRLPARLLTRGRHVVDVASGRARHRRVLTELVRLRRAMDELAETQRRLEAVWAARASE